MPLILTRILRKMTVNRLISILILGPLCYFMTPIMAQEPSPHVSVIQAWQGHTRVPGWIEVTYRLNNEGEAWDGTITIYDAANKITYQTPVSLPQHSRKIFRVPLLSSNGFDLTSSIQDELNKGPVISLPFTPVNSSRVCAYIGTSQFTPSNKLPYCPTSLYLQTLDELPETPMVWDSVDVLIINGINTNTLTDKQGAAMVAWVGSGGHLIISGGLVLNLTLTHLPAELKIANVGPVSIGHSNPEVATSPLEIASAQLSLTPGVIPLYQDGNLILAARKFIGQGSVDIIGWDVTQTSNLTWLGDLWLNDPVPATALEIFGERSTSAQIGPSVYELEEIPRNHMPRLWIWMIVFLIYVFMIGPATFLILQRLKKLIYAWLLIPGWIITALVIISLILSGSYGKTFPLVHDIAYIFINDAELPARFIQGTAITAPQSRKITWSSPGYIRPLWGQFTNESWRFEGTPYPFNVINQQDMVISTGKPNGMITWGIEGVTDGAALNAALSVTMNKKTPTVSGSLYSEIALENVTLVWLGNQDQTVLLAETVSPFETVVISSSLSTTQSYMEPISVLCGSYSNALREPAIKPISALTTEPVDEPTCFISAKSAEVPFPTSDIAGAYTGESCLVYMVPCPEQDTGPFTTQLVGNSSVDAGGWIDTQTDMISPYPPVSTYIYQLPDYIHIRQITSIRILMKPVNTSESMLHPETEDAILLLLWDWQNNEWIPQSMQSLSEEGYIELVFDKSEVDRYFNLQEKSIQLQLNVPENTYPQIYLPVSIEGIW
jgi:hypothetical protein